MNYDKWVYFEPFAPTDEPLARLKQILPDWLLNDQRSGSILLPSSKLLESGNPALESGNTSERDARTPEGKRKDYQEKDEITPIILIIDQFEECFTMCKEEKRKEFIDKLTGLIETKPNLQLIIGMRSDFRSRLKEYPEFAKKMSKVNVDHLNREEIQEAIEKPAEWVGLGIEGSLKQQLINDVEDYPGSLPLLQYTLTELWNEARKQGEQFLRLEIYQQLGGIEGTLEKRANAVYESLPEQEQAVAKRIFLELTQVGDTFDVRRRVRLGDLINSHYSLEILEQVTQKLANKDNRLITRTEIDEEISQVSENSPQSEIRSPQSKIQNLKSKIQIDVVHEALIRHWKRLGDWKQKYQNGMVIERRIEELAQEWEKRGRKNQELYPASKLGIVEGYLKDFGEWGMLDGMAEEFITESRKHKQVVRRNWLIGGTTIGLILLVAAISSLMFGLEANANLQKIVSVLAKNSQESFDSNTNKEFDALLTSLNAAKQLKKLAFGINLNTKMQVKEALQPTFRTSSCSIYEV